MTVRAETPTHRISVTPDSRLDESATAVIVLQRGSLLFKYRPEWILKVIVSLHSFFYSQGIQTLNHPTFMERISIELNLKGYRGLLLSAMFLTK